MRVILRTKLAEDTAPKRASANVRRGYSLAKVQGEMYLRNASKEEKLIVPAIVLSILLNSCSHGSVLSANKIGSNLYASKPAPDRPVLLCH